MSGTYSLRLVVVSNLTTTNSRNILYLFVTANQVLLLTTYLIRNALAIRPLAAGIAAVDRIRPLGGEDFSAAFADSILPFSNRRCFKSF